MAAQNRIRAAEAPGFVLQGIPEPEYSQHMVEAYAETGPLGAAQSCDVRVARTSDGALLLDLKGRDLVEVGGFTAGGAGFQLQSPDTLRALAGALLGAIAAAERAGVIAPAGRHVGGPA